MTTASPSTNGTPATAREAAHYYLGMGWTPLPLPGRCKKPTLEGWQDLRPTAADLDALFPSGAERNVGVLLGEPSGGLVDVDLDTAEAVAAAAILLPPTGRVSGRPGKPKSHYWYLVNEPPRKAAEKFLDCDRTDLLELRSTGGQTVVPPSLHDATGERIVWHSAEEPARVELPSLRSTVRAVAAAAILARHWPAKGARHDARLDLAGGLLRGGASEDFAVDFLTAVCTAARNQDVDDCVKVVRDTAEKIKAGKKAQGWPSLAKMLTSPADDVIREARGWLGLRSAAPAGAADKPKRPLPPEPFRPFPIEVLPQPIRAFGEQAAAAIGCDASFVALPALAVVASLVGNTRVVRLKRGWTEPCVLWTCIIGESGTLKSPAIHSAAGPVYRLQEELRSKFKADLEAYEEAKAVYADKKRKAKADGKEFTEKSPEPPVPRRAIVSDITVEKIAQVLEDNPRGVLLPRRTGGVVREFYEVQRKARRDGFAELAGDAPRRPHRRGSKNRRQAVAFRSARRDVRDGRHPAGNPRAMPDARAAGRRPRRSRPGGDAAQAPQGLEGRRDRPRGFPGL